MDHKTLTDDALAELLGTGSPAVFEEIYRRYDKLLFLYAYKRLQNREDAKDAVQDVFVRLFKNKESLVLKTTLAGYLYKSVLNQVLDIFKHKKIIQKYVDSNVHFIDVDSQETDYLIREKEIEALIEHEISQLPPKMRRVYELNRKSYLSPKEIAQQLGISEHTVYAQLRAALKNLKTRLGVVIFLLYIINR